MTVNPGYWKLICKSPATVASFLPVCGLLYIIVSLQLLQSRALLRAITSKRIFPPARVKKMLEEVLVGYNLGKNSSLFCLDF